MNKKGFTLIELLAVVVIMAIIALIATPNIVGMMDKGKKEDYIADAKEIITKATYMYKQEKYRSDTNIFSGNKILLKNINGIEDDFKDPYGLNYDVDKSYVLFVEPSSTGLAERKVSITLISHDDSDCYTIDNVEKSKLDTNSVKQGTWSGSGCTVTS